MESSAKEKATISSPLQPSQTSQTEGIYDIIQHIQKMPPRSNVARVNAILFDHKCSATGDGQDLLNPEEPDANSVVLQISILWKLGVPAALLRSSRAELSLLQRYMPAKRRVHSGTFTAEDFYNNVHVPDSGKEAPAQIQSPLLTAQLYPFQARAVEWLLHREGVQIGSDGTIVPDSSRHQGPAIFERVVDACGRGCYISHLSGEVRADKPHSTMLNGGILAEEMGLGKTVELINLILLHQRPQYMYNEGAERIEIASLHRSAATLIITPPAILRQWQTELEMHAPSLRVMVYDGVKHSSELSDQALKAKLSDQDVVITTYGVLASEIHYAEEKRDRGLRHTKKYAPRRSPLVDISWWRVCLDEAQMIESGVSNAAKVARRIPRVNAWAVSGTPLRRNTMDLFGLLIFLQYEPFCLVDVWKRTTRDELAALFRQIALRHTKSKLRDELKLPDQKRLVLSMAFSATEEQNYIDIFQQMCADCGLDGSGGPLQETWNPNAPETVEKMRSWLSRLRQTCLHAEMGVRNRRALGNRDGPLRTIDEVLDVMISQNETALRAAERNYLTSKITQGQIYSFGKEAPSALQLFLSALEEANVAVDECRKELQEELLRTGNSTSFEDSAGAVAPGDASDDTEEDDDDEEQRGREQVCRQRVRAMLEIQHICLFFAATGNYQVKEDNEITQPDSDEYRRLESEEASLYERAKAVRRELLSDVSRKTERSIKAVLSRKFAMPGVIDGIPIRGGIVSRRLVDELELVCGFLNLQAKQFEEWRASLVKQVTARLLDAEEELEMTGEEYEASTKLQDESYALLEALRFSIADRNCLITGQVNTLINYEMKQALQQLNSEVQEDVPEERGPAPELMRTILSKRSEINPPQNIRSYNPREYIKTYSLRGVLSQLRSAHTAVQWNGSNRGSKAEAAILEEAMQYVQQLLTAQTKSLAAAEKDVDLLRTAINQRLEYYRQLQQVSDTVKPLAEEMRESADAEKLSKEVEKQDKYAETLGKFKTKRRFLKHLKLESSDHQEPRICVICRDTFDNGVLTVCGHQFCAECIRHWWSSHGNCPMCKRQLRSSDFHNITYKPRELEARAETSLPGSEDGSPAAGSGPVSIYTAIEDQTLNEIKMIDLPGASFGSKVDTMVRHILWLRSSDPGAKTIIFSQYRDFLDVIGQAFRSSKIGFSEMSTKSGNGILRFREDASVECFLLHAKADSSGLNLVNATHVILAEPLINAAIELQAIARVHRIGQRRPTTVWMYIIKDTVEEAIYEISVARRLELIYRRRKPQSSEPSRATTPRPLDENMIDAANTLEIQSADATQLFSKGQSGGEIVRKDDLWSCLFGKQVQERKDLLLAPGSEGAGAQEVGRFMRAEAADQRRTAELARR